MLLFSLSLLLLLLLCTIRRNIYVAFYLIRHYYYCKHSMVLYKMSGVEAGHLISWARPYTASQFPVHALHRPQTAISMTRRSDPATSLKASVPIMHLCGSSMRCGERERGGGHETRVTSAARSSDTPTAKVALVSCPPSLPRAPYTSRWVRTIT